MLKGKGKTILAWIILLSIPLTGLWCQHSIGRLCDAAEDDLKTARAALEASALESAISRWQDHQLLLTTLITHEEVDAVSQSLRRSLAFLEADNTEEFYAALDEALVDLTVVRQFDRISIRSIF